MYNLLHNIPSEVYKAYFKPPDEYQQLANLKICSENPLWHSGPIPRLSELSVKTLARFFPRYPHAGLSLKGSDRARFMNNLSTTHPIALTAEWISDDPFWRRCCMEQLPTLCDVTSHGNSYKRMYLEKHLQGLLENFRPLEMDLYDIKDLLSSLEPYVKKLEVDSLLPPIVYTDAGADMEGLDDDNLSSLSGAQAPTDAEPDADPGQDPGSPRDSPVTETSDFLDKPFTYDSELLAPPEINMKVPCNHLDFSMILPSLGELREFKVCYQVKNCGMSFRWNIFGMTTKDADMLGSGLKACKRLRRLTIRNSHMDDDKFYSIYDGLKHINRLESLSLPNNLLTDESMESIVKILNVHHLRSLDLTNNQLRCDGVKALAKFIVTNGPKMRLEKIILALNKVQDEGCQVLLQALETSKTIQYLDISSNRITTQSCNFVAQLLKTSKTLTFLNIACNKLSPEGGALIMEGLKHNDLIQRIDTRLCNTGNEVEFAIQSKLKANRLEYSSLGDHSSTTATMASHSEPQTPQLTNFQSMTDSPRTKLTTENNPWQIQ